VNETILLAERFQAHRAHLMAVAYRMLGSTSEADDAVQETWLRFSRSDSSAVDNLESWLTRIVSRVCLTALQERRLRPETPLDADVKEASIGPAPQTEPEREALLADSIGVALLVVLDTLAPAERVAFVLHDTFAVPFDDIAPIVGRSAAATRQLASRARRRVQGQGTGRDADGIRQSRLVSAFLAASRNGDFAALLAVLDPDVVLRADEAAVKMGTVPEIRGAKEVAAFARRASGARPALVDGLAGAVWMPGGRPRVVFRFTIGEAKIVGIELIADPKRLGEIDLVAGATAAPASSARRSGPG
jgi:RNA polymerase sigma factor (sigma-70 family)